MRRVFFLVYTLMALWLVAAAALRVVLSLRGGIAVDVLPAITGSLGVVALLLLVPRALHRVSKWRRPDALTLAEQLERSSSRRPVDQ